MPTWYIYGRGNVAKPYRLPARCRRCNSRGISAQLSADLLWVEQSCPACGEHRRHRLHTIASAEGRTA